MELERTVADWYDRNGANDDDHFTQPGLLFNKESIVNRQLCHFLRADPKLGTAVAKSLGVDVDAVLKELKHETVKI